MKGVGGNWSYSDAGVCGLVVSRDRNLGGIGTASARDVHLGTAYGECSSKARIPLRSNLPI
jgi:hypothetical protein